MPDFFACCTEPVDATDPDVLVGYYVGPILVVDGCDGTTVTVAREGRFEELDGDSLGQSLPAGWFPCGARPGVTTGGGGGGGGGAGSYAQIEFTWQQGTFDDGGSTTSWPDGGAMSTLAAEHWTPAPITGATLTTWTCVGVTLVVHNVASATSGAIQVTLQDDGGNVYATVTIASGTSPDSPGTAKFIKRSTNASAAAGVGTRLQWVINDAPSGNDYWVEAFALGVLS